ALPTLDQTLTRWDVFPRTKPDSKVEAKGLAERSSAEASHDWLLLYMTDPHAKLPAQPLTPRLKPAERGETVYLVGVPYSDHDSAQNVYKGVVTDRPSQNYFVFKFDPPVRLAGFSGAPIVDKNGLLVGNLGSRSPEAKKKDGMDVEGGGEDVALAL